MAGEFLKSHGIDIDAEMARIQTRGGDDTIPSRPVECIQNVALPGKESDHTWNVHLKDDRIERVIQSQADTNIPSNTVNGHGALMVPSLCHPHIHLDKAYLLSHPKYAHLQVEKGDFQEAMDLTGQAKSQFEREDLLERGQRVIDESVAAGVTHMRAFVEVDAGVQVKCLEAGLTLKERSSKEHCHIQLCAFAQLPLFSATKDDQDGNIIRELMKAAARNPDVEAIGSTPYVEADREKMLENIEWMIDSSLERNLHLDFHLDYNLDSEIEPLVWHVIRTLKDRGWKHLSNKTVVLGHCTRLSLFDEEEWQRLSDEILRSKLPISFVGLPTSDLFMMRTGNRPEVRGTLDVLDLINKYKLNACMGVNNIGNAFTPYGSCDPLSLACHGVGIYQAGTQKDAETLLECVSTRAKAAIGVGRWGKDLNPLDIQPGDSANLLLFQGPSRPEMDWRTRKTVSDAVYLYDNCQGRRVFSAGPTIHPTHDLT